MALLQGAMFQESVSGKEFAAFASATLPILAEAAITFTVCRDYLVRPRERPVSIPTSIKSILLINFFLTLLFLLSTLSEGVMVSAKYTVELSDRKNKEGGITPLDLLALGLVWMVVVVYVGSVARAGFRVVCQAEGEKGSWSLQALRKSMHLVDRSKWVGLCFAFFFSTWGFFNGPFSARAYVIWKNSTYMGERPTDMGGRPTPRWDTDILAFLLETVNTQEVWRWTAASSTLILLALVSLYTIAARIALYVSCKRFSLQEADDELARAESPLACLV